MKRLATASLSAAALAVAVPVVAQEKVEGLPKTELQIAGGLSNLTLYQQHEQPFWTKTVPELSGGQVTATIKGFNEMGLKGPEMLRLMTQGVIPIGTSTLAYFATDNPINEAIDLAGLAPTMELAREITEAYKPAYEAYYDKQNIKVLGFSSYPAQVLFCNAEVNALADLKGKKVRTSSRTQAEFVEAFGAGAVTIPFGEVVPALQNGVVDCAITGSMSGYSAKWYEVSTHLFALPINWNQQIHAANKAYWNKLDPKVQDFLQTNLDAMFARIWEAAGRETQEGYDCNTGAEACTQPVKGNMKLVIPSEEDKALLKKTLEETILPKWAARCSDQCVNDFNNTIAKVVGITANK